MIRAPVTIHHDIYRILVTTDIADESGDLDDIRELPAGCLYRCLQPFHDSYCLSLGTEVEVIELGRDVWVAVRARRRVRGGQEYDVARAHFYCG